MPIISRSQNDREALVRNGPTLLVEILPPKEARVLVEKAGKAAPIEKAGALIDTGAGRTSIDSGIAQRLGLIPRDKIVVHTAGGIVHQMLYDATLLIPALGFSRELPVFGAPLASQSFHVLIGRDLLACGTLVYSGWKGGFEFCV